MIRNLKFLGLAVIVAMVFGAIVAQMAAAEAFTSPETPSGTTTLTHAQEKHKETVTNNSVFDKTKFTNGTRECSGATANGAQTGSSSETLEATPTYSGCTLAGLETRIDTNGCRHRFHITGAKIGTTDIFGCTESEFAYKGMAVTVGPPSTLRCIIDIPEQNGLVGVTYSNIGAGTTREITVAIDANNLKYKETEGSGVGKCTTSAEQTNGILEAAETITGETSSGTHLGILVD